MFGELVFSTLGDYLHQSSNFHMNLHIAGIDLNA